MMSGQFSSIPLPFETKLVFLEKKIWTKFAPIPLERLHLLKFSYYNFDLVECSNGEMVTLDIVALSVLNIFRQLYRLKFPINKSIGIENYDGNDEKSMADNNSSCYNFRQIKGSKILSIHSYGLAIDINPVENPCVFYTNSDDLSSKILKIFPYLDIKYLNRQNLQPGMVEQIVEIFAKEGFSIWGGNWNNPVDWQHFQTSRAIAEILAFISYSDGIRLFALYKLRPKMLNTMDSLTNHFISLYQKNPVLLIEYFENNQEILDLPGVKALEILDKISIFV